MYAHLFLLLLLCLHLLDLLYYIHQYQLHFLLQHLQIFDHLLLLHQQVHFLFLALCNILCNLSHFSLCNRMYAHLFLLLLLCLHLLDLLYYIHQYQLHFLLQHLQIFDHLLLLHQQVHFLFLALCNILCNLSHFSLCNRMYAHLFLLLLLCLHLLDLLYYIHQYQLHFLLQHFQMFDRLLLLHLQVLFLFLALCNILYNLSRFSLCNRMYAHLFLLLLLCLHLLDLLYYIHQYQLHFLLQHFQMFDRLLLLHLQVLFLFLALCNILCNSSHFFLYNIILQLNYYYLVL